eukprot:scaffold803_cov310-Pinguiococcus_pyrenoidosus.AAC.154
MLPGLRSFVLTRAPGALRGLSRRHPTSAHTEDANGDDADKQTCTASMLMLSACACPCPPQGRGVHPTCQQRLFRIPPRSSCIGLPSCASFCEEKREKIQGKEENRWRG